MPRIALALCIVWFLALFVFRSALHWRKTGSTGVKGFHGPIGSPPWIAGAAVSLGLALAPLAPLAALNGWPGGALLIAHLPLHLVGVAIALVGIVGALAAQLSMGDSWRVGVDETEETQLVTGGLYDWVRNPIFSFVFLSALGFTLLVPNALSVLGGLLTVLGIEMQVRSVEEPYLKRTHGEAYARYAANVGRFLPGLGQLRAAEAGIGDRG